MKTMFSVLWQCRIIFHWENENLNQNNIDGQYIYFYHGSLEISFISSLERLTRIKHDKCLFFCIRSTVLSAMTTSDWLLYRLAANFNASQIHSFFRSPISSRWTSTVRMKCYSLSIFSFDFVFLQDSFVHILKIPVFFHRVCCSAIFVMLHFSDERYK